MIMILSYTSFCLIKLISKLIHYVIYTMYIVSAEFYNIIIHNFILKTIFLLILWLRCSFNKAEMITGMTNSSFKEIYEYS